MATSALDAFSLPLTTMILIECINARFKEVRPGEKGSGGLNPLIQGGGYGREDLEEGPLHAKGLVLKGIRALRVAEVEVRSLGVQVTDFQLQGFKSGMKIGDPPAIIRWEDLTEQNVRRDVNDRWLHLGIVNCYRAMADIKGAMVAAYTKAEEENLENAEEMETDEK